MVVYHLVELEVLVECMVPLSLWLLCILLVDEVVGDLLGLRLQF